MEKSTGVEVLRLPGVADALAAGAITGLLLKAANTGMEVTGWAQPIVAAASRVLGQGSRPGGGSGQGWDYPFSGNVLYPSRPKSSSRARTSRMPSASITTKLEQSTRLR